ncbi:MAG: hypothetical protein GY854_06855 [Deltaproteobacteria bacterium]|nr:hypothetical protein [Deltaproteobacteria bacterium]
MKEPLLLGAIVLFILALIFRLVRGLRLGRRMQSRAHNLPPCADSNLESLLDEARKTGKVREALREIGHRAPGLDSAGLRAAYRCAGGHLALTSLKRPALAAGFYLRALREDPGCVEALDKLQEILTGLKRIRRLERTYWDVLGRLDDSEVGDEMWTKCWSGLASIYSNSPRTLRRADAIRKALTAFGTDDNEDGDVSEITPFINAAKPQ